MNQYTKFMMYLFNLVTNNYIYKTRFGIWLITIKFLIISYITKIFTGYKGIWFKYIYFTFKPFEEFMPLCITSNVKDQIENVKCFFESYPFDKSKLTLEHLNEYSNEDLYVNILRFCALSTGKLIDKNKHEGCIYQSQIILNEHTYKVGYNLRYGNFISIEIYTPKNTLNDEVYMLAQTLFAIIKRCYEMMNINPLEMPCYINICYGTLIVEVPFIWEFITKVYYKEGLVLGKVNFDNGEFDIIPQTYRMQLKTI